MTRWLQLIMSFVPSILNAINPNLGLASTAITQGITEAEALSGATGPQKLEHSINIMNDVITAINTGSGKVVIDPVAVNNVAGSVISTIVGVVNLISKTQTPDVASVQTPPVK